MSKPKQGSLFGGLIDYSKPPEDICAAKHGGSPTSESAHEKSAPSHPSERQQILDWLRQRGQKGGTAKEYAALPGKNFNAISGRWTELKRDGFIMHAGQIRDGAAVYLAIQEER